MPGRTRAHSAAATRPPVGSGHLRTAEPVPLSATGRGVLGVGRTRLPRSATVYPACGAMSGSLDSIRLSRLIEAGRALVAELDPQAVLDRILTTAREVTGARYAALGILDEQRTGLGQFVTLGVDEQTRAAIGDLPRGRGVLGVLI